MKIEEKLPSGSLAITVVLRSTPPFLSSVLEKLQFESSSKNAASKITFPGKNYWPFDLKKKKIISAKKNVSPFVSSSSMVALESVDSLTWDPSLFFDIKFLLLKFLDTSIVVKMAPYKWRRGEEWIDGHLELRANNDSINTIDHCTHLKLSTSIEFLQAIDRLLSVYHRGYTFSLLKYEHKKEWKKRREKINQYEKRIKKAITVWTEAPIKRDKNIFNGLVDTWMYLHKSMDA